MQKFCKILRIKVMLITSMLLLLSAIIPTYAQSSKVWAAKGEQALNKNNFDKAIEYFTKSIAKDSADKNVVYKRGLAFLNSMHLDEAIDDFNRAIALDTNFMDAYNNRGLALSFTENQKEAIDDFNKVIANDSNFAIAYINRGVCYINTLNYASAYNDFNKAESLAPDNPSIYFQRARAYYRQRKYDLAIQDYSKCIDLGFKNSKVYYSRANCYFNLKQYQDALNDYNKAYKDDSKNPEILNNRAVAYDKLGETELANQDRKKLAALTGFNFSPVPIDSLVFKPYVSDLVGTYTINLPENWTVFNSQDTNSIDLLISADKIDSKADAYSVGVNMSLTSNMKAKYGQTSIEEILNFWKGSLTQNSAQYFQYQIFYEKQKQLGEWDRVTRKIRVKFTKDSAPLNMYEVALIKPGAILYAFFQAPESLWNYYEKIYDKAIESIKIKL